MKIVSLSVPAPFTDGPQYDEETGELIPGSWPAGLPHEGMQMWHPHGVPDTGLALVDMLVPDDWPVGAIPGGWLNDSSHLWDGVTQDIRDEEGELVESALTTETLTDEVQYTKHVPPPTDEDGVPTGDPAVYHRIHKIFGWPDISD